ncbi:MULTISPECIES: 16S rRNA pseudouridine(516) synthase [Enterococcus]|uniref:16S rRNA pseudouridine(516) synthase n=1 Tax=Enterococcus TaxID=1350 RepID=UPI00065E5581|nr:MULTISPECIES: 16S rRNA pseudouridine(516) synthase [Enterococcus]KAF1300951.1 16S rRNA pseudouridine(516) synthase [Enterococcus sp. JM9B]
MRLDKLIEKELKTSRKEMKRLFLLGKVSVDGQIQRREARNVDSDLHQILVDGKSLATDEAYYLVNKPQGIVTANQDAQHQTVLDLLAEADRREKLAAVGRLDRDTEGLVFLTTNGQLAYELLHPVKKVTKCYEATVNGRVTQEDQQAFQQGIVFHDGTICQPAELTILFASDEKSTIRLAIQEGKFHQVKKMFLVRGKKVVFLKRTAIGPLRLPETLALGKYRRLTVAELQQLTPYFR